MISGHRRRKSSCTSKPNRKKNHSPWNKGKLSGQKRPLKLREIWAIRIRLELQEKTRDLALFNLAIDSMKWSNWIGHLVKGDNTTTDEVKNGKEKAQAIHR